MRNVMLLVLPFLLMPHNMAMDEASPKQLANWLKRFPDADANGDGRLTVQEAAQYRRKRQAPGRRKGPPSTFEVDAGWDADQFPEHAVCYRSPEEIKDLYAKLLSGKGKPVTSYPQPKDESLRIVGTGHSFMAPGYQTLPLIARAAGLDQPPLFTHTGGGMTGSARYKWEQENGIFQFDGRPTPKLLASISNAKWDAMMWGPYYNDRTEYYACWIDFCLKYNPHMKFFLADAWPQLGQLKKMPQSESELTTELFVDMGRQKNAINGELIAGLREDHSQHVYIMPTSDAMVRAVACYHRGELPGVEGIHSSVGGKQRSLWRDVLGHLGPGIGDLEGYVFYATLYGRSPELIEDDIRPVNESSYPGRDLDRVFRRIAWQAVVNHPYSGVQDRNNDGIADEVVR